MFILYTCTVSRKVKPVSVPCVHLYSHELDLESAYQMNISDNSKMKIINSIIRECEDKFQIIFMIDMVIHFKSVSNCTSEQLTRTFAVLVESRRTDKHTPM